MPPTGHYTTISGGHSWLVSWCGLNVNKVLVEGRVGSHEELRYMAGIWPPAVLEGPLYEWLGESKPCYPPEWLTLLLLQKYYGCDTSDDDTLDSAIRHIPADSYDVWINVGRCFLDLDRSMEEWDEWSKRSSKYADNVGSDSIESKWASFKRGSVDIARATIFRLALDHGWIPPRAKQRGYEYAPKFVDADELLATPEEPINWFIEFVLHDEQLMAIFGYVKTLKTLLAVGMAAAVASGKKWLLWNVPKPERVAYVSGEAGKRIIRKLLRRWKKQLEADSFNHNLHIDFVLPELPSVTDVQRLVKEIKRRGCKLVFIDPLVGCATSGSRLNSYNANDMAPVLLRLVHSLREVGCTVVLLAHSRKNKTAKVPTLHDVLGAGLDHIAGQWFGIKTIKEYDKRTGVSELRIATGGREFAGFDLRVRVEEGRHVDELKIDVTSLDDDEVDAEVVEPQEPEEVCRQSALLFAALNELKSHEETENSLRTAMKIGKPLFNAAMKSLVDQGLLEKVKLMRRGKHADGLRLVGGGGGE
jgi:hypothetical protein